MEERDPTKSNAIKSSLWEVVLLQKHCIPSVSTAARFISHPMPKQEWNLSSVLELKENEASSFNFLQTEFHILKLFFFLDI